MEIVLRALEAPARQIANNSGLEGSVIVEQVKSQSQDVLVIMLVTINLKTWLSLVS